jgi:hypothetical protein
MRTHGSGHPVWVLTVSYPGGCTKDQPFRGTKTSASTVVAQLPQTERHLGAYLRVESATAAPGEECMKPPDLPYLSRFIFMNEI